MPKKSPATVSALAPADYNPRTISDDQLERLQDSLSRLGDLSGVIYNRRTGNLVGGHQRAKALPEASTITLETQYRRPTKTGTKAEGYVLTPEGERYAYREVDWDLNTEKLANVTANRLHGEFDWTELSGVLKEMEPELIEAAGFTEDEMRSLVNLTLDMDLGDDEDEDEDSEDEESDAQVSTIQMIQLFYEPEEKERFEEVEEELRAKLKTETPSETILKVMEDAYKSHKARKRASR